MAAVHDGYVLSRSVERTALAGHLLTRCMRQSVEAGGTVIRPRFSFKKVDQEEGGYEVEGPRLWVPPPVWGAPPAPLAGDPFFRSVVEGAPGGLPCVGLGLEPA